MYFSEQWTNATLVSMASVGVNCENDGIIIKTKNGKGMVVWYDNLQKKMVVWHVYKQKGKWLVVRNNLHSGRLSCRNSCKKTQIVWSSRITAPLPPILANNRSNVVIFIFFANSFVDCSLCSCLQISAQGNWPLAFFNCLVPDDRQSWQAMDSALKEEVS